MKFRNCRNPVCWFGVASLALFAAPLFAQQPAAGPAKRQIGQMVLDGVPEVDPALRERLLQYLQIRPTTLRGVSEDGKSIIIGTRFGDTNQLHLLTMPLGMRKQITFFD